MGGETSQVTSDGFVAKILAINVYNEFSLRNSPELLSVLQGSTRKGKAGKKTPVPSISIFPLSTLSTRFYACYESFNSF